MPDATPPIPSSGVAAANAPRHSAPRPVGRARWVRIGIVFIALALPVPGLASTAVAPLPAPRLADCNGPSSTPLYPAARRETDARAYWLDRRLVQWPGRPAEGRYRLVRSSRAGLRANVGLAVAGAEEAFVLSPAHGPLGRELAARFGFVGEGARLRLDEAATNAVAAHVSDQWLLVQEDMQGRVLDATYLQVPGLLDDLHAGAVGADIGAHVDAVSARFHLWAPMARHVALCLFDTGTATAQGIESLSRDPATGIWSGQVIGDLRGRYYTYLVDVFVPGHGLVRNRVTDPYSVSLTADSRRSYIADLEDPALKPEGWATAPRPAAPAALTDMAVYELHVRDFSVGDASVPSAHRGRYLGFTHARSAGMRHLRGLREAGLTDIHLLPVFDIATVPEQGCVTPDIPRAASDSPAQQAAVQAVAARDCFNWGYDPYHFNAPEGSYATDAVDGAVRIREFRRMVQALHAAGLRVGMDVVYNHTTTSGQAPTSVLDRIVPGYYHRLDAKGSVERSTCCENTATEHRMMARLMIDSVVLWARHYRIDSFRFDLMGHQPRAAMQALQTRLREEIGREIPLIGEGWNFGEIANGARFVQAIQGELDGTGIATFSDRARDALRGGGCCDSGRDLLAQQGLLNGLVYAPNAHADPARPRRDLLHAADLARAGLAGTLRDYTMPLADGRTAPLSKLDYKGQPAGYASQPGEVVNYSENHDNLTLFDINVLRLPGGTPREERARVQLLGAAFIALSQGMAYFHAGQEVLRSKSLDRNSFDSGDAFNRLDWTYADNGFGGGLPKAAEGAKDWSLFSPFLRDASIRPTPREIRWTRDAFQDLLRIRASSPLLRLRTADEVKTRLEFLDAGPSQNPLLIAARLDGRGMPQARFDSLVYLINVSPRPQALTAASEAGRRYALHPVHRRADAADRRARKAHFDPVTGRFTVPARTAVVFVVDAPLADSATAAPTGFDLTP